MDNFTQKLILAVKERPILYDKNHIDYKHSFKKAVAWTDVSNAIGGEDGEIVREKWKNLRDTYKKHKKTQLHTPSGPADYKWKRWAWAPQMAFMDTLMSMKNRRSQFYRNSYIQPTGSDKRIDAQTCLGSLNKDQHNTMELKRGPSAGSTSQDNKVNSSNNMNYGIKRRILEPPDEKADYLKTPKREQHGELDAIDLLFMHYAETLKTFTPRTQAVLKLELAKTFAEAELEIIEEMEHRGRDRSSIKMENVAQYSSPPAHYSTNDSSSYSD